MCAQTSAAHAVFVHIVRCTLNPMHSMLTGLRIFFFDFPGIEIFDMQFARFAVLKNFVTLRNIFGYEKCF
jgi:hypothetical protein